MISIQKSIGQGVISLISKKIVGHVKGFSVKNNRIDLIYCFNDEEETEFSFPSKNILSIGDDAVIIKSENSFSVSEEENSDCILGLPVLTQKGKKLGHVLDMEINDNFHIETLVLQNKKIVSSEIDIINNKFILLKGKYKVKNRKIKNNSFNYLVKIEKNEILPENLNLPKITDEIKTQTPTTPAKKIANISGIIGRTITKDIFYKDKIIIKAGSVINQKIIELATISGNLNNVISNSI